MLAFDYRRTGDSGGRPRQVLPIRNQLADWQASIAAFQDLYSVAAKPFNWKYTTKDLHAFLARLDAHQHRSPLALAA